MKKEEALAVLKKGLKNLTEEEVKKLPQLLKVVSSIRPPQ